MLVPRTRRCLRSAGAWTVVAVVAGFVAGAGVLEVFGFSLAFGVVLFVVKYYDRSADHPDVKRMGRVMGWLVDLVSRR